MAKTKNTPRKEGYRCPMCCLRINEERGWEQHVLDCGRKRREKRFECEICDYASNKKSDLGRHCRTRHGGVGTATAGSGTDEEWEQQDPGNLSDVVGGTEQSNAESGESCKRKPTRPAPVTSTKRKIAGRDFLVPSAPSPFQHPMTTPRKQSTTCTSAQDTPESCVSPSREVATQTLCDLETVNIGTQTFQNFEETGTQTDGSKRRKLERVQETYQRDGKSIVTVVEEENWY